MKIGHDNDVTDRTDLIYTKIRTKLSWEIRRMWSFTKSRQDNNVIDHIGVISIEYDTE